MTVITETNRLILRTVEPEDAAASFAVYSDPQVMKWLDGNAPFTRLQESAESIQRGIECQMRHGVSHWAVVLKKTGEFIGHCGFHPAGGDSTELELVVHLNRKYWGQHYGSEAAVAACDYVIGVGEVNRIIALTMPLNVSAQKLLLSAGFTRKRESSQSSARESEGSRLLLFELLPTDKKAMEQGSGRDDR